MRLTTILATICIGLVMFQSEAKADVPACNQIGCALVTVDSAVDCYDATGLLQGTITGVGGNSFGKSFGGEGLVATIRSNWIYIHDLESDTQICNGDLGNAANRVVIKGPYAYVTHPVTHGMTEVYIPTCAFTSVPTPISGAFGTRGPAGITTTDTDVWIAYAFSGHIGSYNFITQLPSGWDVTLNDMDQLDSIKYDSILDVLFISGTDGIWKVNLPGPQNATMYMALPSRTASMDMNDTYIVAAAGFGNEVFVITKGSSPSYNTIFVEDVKSVAVNDDTIFAVGNAAPDIGVNTFNINTLVEQAPITTSPAYHVSWTNPGPFCGDGEKNGVESCDSTDLDGETCQSQSFDNGTLACNGSCNFDVSSCYSCGDGNVDTGEGCDGTNLSGETCSSQGFAGGTLVCNSLCQLNTAGCYRCGDNTLNGPTEQCDGYDFGGDDCTDYGYDYGTLSCSATCTIDQSNCHLAACGDGILNGTELCDATQLGTATCEDQNFDGGVLNCNATCDGYDTSGCYICGDGIVNGPLERCDGNDMDGDTCQDHGYDGGQMACDNTCWPITNGCWKFCGNSQIDNDEECDGDLLQDETCETLGLGYIGGTLTCKSDCTFNTNNCEEAPLCGNGILDFGEQCDGTNVNGHTCDEWGYYGGGTPKCSADCSEYDLSDCIYVPPKDDKGGCNCSTPSNNTTPPWFVILLGLIALLSLRRRLQ